MRRPNKIRQLPPAVPTSESDVFIVSQIAEDGLPQTRQMPQPQLFSEFVQEVNESRAVLVARVQGEIDALKVRIAGNEGRDDQLESALTMLEQMVNGESGDTPYDLWLEAGNTGSIQDYLATLVGPQGPKGDAGRNGIDGRDGKDGAPGATGPSGIAGPVGPQGEPGPVGPQGPKGDTGAKGDKGDKGDRGDFGPVGGVGATGPKGDKGDAGPVGPTGATGATGPQGPAGTPGNTLVGTATITETALIALTAGVRKVNVSVPGVVTSGNYVLFPVSSTPAGYAIADAVCTTAGTLQVSITAPILALGASYSIPVRVVRINT